MDQTFRILVVESHLHHSVQLKHTKQLNTLSRNEETTDNLGRDNRHGQVKSNHSVVHTEERTIVDCDITRSTRNGAAEDDAGALGLVMGPCIVEIDRIVIREVQYHLEVNRCRNEVIIVKGNFGWAWPMWAGRPRVGNWAMYKIQYQFEVNRWAILGGRGLCGRGAPGLVMEPCIVEINRIAIRDVQYQFEMNRCRNKEVIVKGNFDWATPMWAGRLRIDHIVIREVQYQFEVNRCRNEEIIVKGNFGWAWHMWAGRLRVNNGAMHNVQYQFEDNRCRMARTDGRTDRRTAEITTISPRFSKSLEIKTILDGCGLIWAGCPGIDRIVIRDVQYQFEVNRCRNEEIIVKGNFGWAWPMWPERPRVGNGAMHKAQYQFEVKRCRNEEIIVRGWAWPMWAGRPRVGNWACIVEINCIVVREVQNQFEVNRWTWPMWAWPMWAGRPRAGNGAMHKVQYQCEVNRCRNEEIITKGSFGWAWPMWAGCPRIDRIVIRDVQYQFEVNRCRNEEIIVKGNFGWAWPM
ncbi:hypothetical protein DPMN_038509 [Dreissena polymorpha]|uniref:Uncharacterized protein n=1 Tax=Dreissena polymorpha TaxID=45954 RepID=A0A9D4MH79_DREPO|nr:hypothetical protein DPMN_038509 [Dreissena polymorpha]